MTNCIQSLCCSRGRAANNHVSDNSDLELNGLVNARATRENEYETQDTSLCNRNIRIASAIGTLGAAMAGTGSYFCGLLQIANNHDALLMGPLCLLTCLALGFLFTFSPTYAYLEARSHRNNIMMNRLQEPSV